MRSSHLFGLLLSTLSLVAVGSTGTGCSDDPGGTAGSGAGGSGAQGGAGGTGAQGGGGPDTDGNNGCDTAEVLDLSGMDVPSKLDPVTSDRDYYKVDLKKGQAIFLGATSKPDDDPYGDSYPDTVITLWSADGKTQIAQNDDMSGSNNSELLYLVPEDGTYCLEVSECGVVFGPDFCAPPEGITNLDYDVSSFELDPTGSLITVDKEPNETPANATLVKKVSFPEGGPVEGYQSIGWGAFSAVTDKDVYTFKVENDVAVDMNSRALCIFDFWAPAGPEGSGSTATNGVLVRVAAASAPDVTLAQTDMSNLDLTFGYPELPSLTMPCDKGKDYLVTLSRPDGITAGSNDFYFFSHVQAGSNTVEKEPNDNSAQGLELTPTDDGTGHVTAITGNITAGDNDVFTVPVPAGMGLASAYCTAERSGSGLRGLQVSLLDGNDQFLKNGSGAEGSDHVLWIDGALITAGATNVKMRVLADSQDPAVTGTYYYCSLILSPQ
ncbi:hypothetical protein [Polyangium jinanense]|uniref:Uncharacterized protein n=1 Tax=Polyangium jinanense TaxID=2829994 RepID=A0A9X3X4F8_9BACT|nr:hypothetical protein [Polyangium jinanense]MDC3955708.1 hypothetical protein [Polyangium jinanense]MDC3982350.1 hypothetical protein [Polyangium jinanense]